MMANQKNKYSYFLIKKTIRAYYEKEMKLTAMWDTNLAK